MELKFSQNKNCKNHKMPPQYCQTDGLIDGKKPKIFLIALIRDLHDRQQLRRINWWLIWQLRKSMQQVKRLNKNSRRRRSLSTIERFDDDSMKLASSTWDLLSKPLLNEQHRRRCIQWAREMKNYYWSQVMASGETIIRLHAARKFSWQRPGERRISRTVKFSLKVNVWGCFYE